MTDFHEIAREDMKPQHDLDAQKAGRLNQCDGCRRHLPIVNGIHYDTHGLPYMGCSAPIYMRRTQ